MGGGLFTSITSKFFGSTGTKVGEIAARDPKAAQPFEAIFIDLFKELGDLKDRVTLTADAVGDLQLLTSGENIRLPSGLLEVSTSGFTGVGREAFTSRGGVGAPHVSTKA